MRRDRTPKVKEFVHAPYIKCPDCGEQKFGVLMVCDSHYARRCIHCWFDKRFALPPIRKKLIYIDQFAISNMMKELDPDRPDSKKGNNDGFYRALFEKLDRLNKLQLIVCPDSPVQFDESVVDTRYEKIRAVFRHLSHSVEFLDPETIFYAQVEQAFRQWLAGKPPDARLDPGFALQGNPHVWQERYRIELHYVVPGLVSELKTLRTWRSESIDETCRRLQSEESFLFERVFETVLASEPRRILREFFNYISRYAAVERGEAPFEKSLAFWPQSVDLITRMLSDAQRIWPSKDEQFAKINEFFNSPHYRTVPYARLSALFWATLARDVRAGRKPENFPTPGIYNDIAAIAAYSGFCDAMFVDKEASHLGAQAEMKRELAGSARLFSLRKKEREAFMAYLDEVEKNADSEHIKLVHDVYGADWSKPFVDLLSTVAQQA